MMTATLVHSPPAAMAEHRRTEILGSVDLLIDVFETWQRDPSGPNVPTEQFERALLNAAAVCENGDTPLSCREICMVAMPRLKEEWDQYADGSRRSNGTPFPRFWAAFDAVVIARKGAKPYVVKSPPPVKQLLDVEKVSPEQIAWHIYGNDRKGPFVRENGSVDHVLLRQEADEPGSVIPLGWTPPWEQERFVEWQNSSSHLIAASDVLKQDGPDYTDPTPIDEMLRQGQFPAAIAAAKRMKVEDVLKAAEKFGIPVPGMPATPITPATPVQSASDPSVMSALLDGKPAGAESNGKPAASTPSATPPVKVTEISPELRDKIVGMVSGNNGVPEIVAALKSEGIAVTQKQVQEVIAKVGG